MVSASISVSTGVRDSSPGEEVVFFLMTLLDMERESASDADVGIYETEPFSEAGKRDSEPPVFQTSASVACDF